MEKWLTPTGERAKSDYITNQVAGLSVNDYIEKVNTENNTVSYKRVHSCYPNLYEKENGSGIDTDIVKTNGMKNTEKLAELDNSVRPNSYKQADSLTVTQTYYKQVINETNYGDAGKVLNAWVSGQKAYWIPARFANCYNSTDFGLLYAYEELMTGSLFFAFNYYAGGGDHGHCIRPVVTLGSEVQVEVSSTASSSTGTPHKITEY